MFKTFKLYMEERDSDNGIEVLKNKLIEKLGFKPDAMKDTALTLRKLNKQQFMQAISSVGLDKNTVEKLKSLFLDHPDTRIQDLLNQIGKNDATESDPRSYDVGQDDLSMGQNPSPVDDREQDMQQDVPEVPAEFPSGQKQLPRKPIRKPLTTDKDIGTSMYGGPPPNDGRMT